MSVVRWSRRDAIVDPDPLAVDELDEVDVLVLDGVSARDDARLGWCGSAPCVVVAVAPRGEPGSSRVDVALVAPAGDESDELEKISTGVAAHPQAARILVEVLRASERLEVRAALTVESLAYSMLLAGPEFAAWLASRRAPQPRTFDRAPVRVERTGDDLHVTLDRPENRNAFSAEMRDALVETLGAAALDRTLERVVLDASGPSFSSGGDLTEFGTARDVVRAHEIRTLRSVGDQLDRLVPRVTARVHGPCVGAGVELSAFASVIVAERDATFCLPEVSMGLIPGAGGTVSLPRRIGRQQTARLALTGDTVGVDEAHRLGLVDHIV